MPKFTFNTFYKRVSEALGLRSQLELAAKLGLNRSAISQAKKKKEVPDKWVLNLYRRYGLNPDWVETGKGRIFIKQSAAGDKEPEHSVVRKVRARLSAGDGSFETSPEISGHYLFQSEWLKRKGQVSEMVLMDISGNSMEPELKNGDTVLIDISQKDILAGLLYAIGIDDTIMVKRIEKHPGKLVLRSDNMDYSPIIIEDKDMNSVRIIGKVVWVCRDLS
jgi:phage repressor protein C with HTH and peptisase S24 domain